MPRVNHSNGAQYRSTLPKVYWTQLNEPGCYVDEASGDLFRFPKEAVVTGLSPIIKRESSRGTRLRQLSTDPFMPTLKARFLCAQHNIKANF
jgi:hypothetical protein